ncbi:hypothetical protein [Streptomyces physcomitrii]|uniref:Uncharacterized protein n=1 Tax=Streptomyces physcomitrii TaxID=2724184 RepID=A0ABX1GZF6_9ACTN|nr:hypothetical protein [Streptomyces physcomitrii]NKI41484.1 hypothetical protein [Streptomyces physcomitrii]
METESDKSISFPLLETAPPSGKPQPRRRNEEGQEGGADEAAEDDDGGLEPPKTPRVGALYATS